MHATATDSKRSPHDHHHRNPTLTAAPSRRGRPRSITSTRATTRRSRNWWSDSLVFAGRNIEHIRQIPEKLLDVTIQPLMFVLLFAYVFGGAIAVQGRQLPRVPHRRHPHPVARVRADRSGDRDLDRPQRRRDRPVPVAARDAFGVPRRPLPRGDGGHGALDRRAAHRRIHRRLAPARRRLPRRPARSCCCSCSARR